MAGIPISISHKQDGEGPPGNIYAWLIWFSGAFFYLYEYFIRVAPSVMSTQLENSFSLSAGELGAAVGTYYYVYGVMQLFVGLFLDKWGVRKVLAPASIAIGIGSVLMILTSNVWVLSASRGIMGLGSAFAFVGAMQLVAVWFPQQRIALLAGLTTTLGVLGGIIAERPMVQLVHLIGWRESWMVCAGIALLWGVVMYLVIPGTPKWITDAKKCTPTDGEKKGVVLGLKRVMGNPQTWIISLISTALFFNLPVLGDLWGVDFVKAYTGSGIGPASITASALYLGWLFGAPVMGYVSDRYRTRKRVLIFSLIASTIASTILLIPAHWSLYGIGALLFSVGFLSSGQVVCFVANIEHNPRWASGTAIAVTNLFTMAIGGFFQLVVGFILDGLRPTVASASNAVYLTNDFRIAMVCLPVATLFGLFLSFFLKESYESRDFSNLPAK